jgi:hypothetical protein
MDKVTQILDLISEKSEGLMEVYQGPDPTDSDGEIFKIEILAQVTVLTELYNEVKLIHKQDD